MRAKDGQLDAEDGPTYVVEDSNDTVTADEAKAMLEEVATPATLGWDKELSPISNPDLPTSSTTPKVNTNEAKPHFPVHIGGAPKKRRIGLLAQPEAQAKTIKKQQTVVNDQRKKKKVHLKSAKPKLSFDEC